MKNLAIIQCRLSSKRLKNKTIFPLGKKTIIQSIYDRVTKSKLIDEVIVAIPTGKKEDLLADILSKNKIPFKRGAPENVLKRFYDIAKLYNPRNIVRLTADCPFIDPLIIDKVISLHLKEKNHYTSNARPPSFPDGMDVEVFSFESLKDAYKNAVSSYEMEHVVPYIVKKYKISNLKNDIDLSQNRWTIDTNDDFNFITKVYKGLILEKKKINLKNILDFIQRHPKIKKINHHLKRNFGVIQSE